jgi:hypothetical protein
MVVGAIVVATTWRRTFHKRIQCIQSNIILGGILRGPAPLSLGWRVRRAYLPDVLVGRARFGMLWWSSSLAFRRGFTRRTLLRDILGLRNHGARRLDEHLGKNSAERTLGGLPLFLFSPAAGATSDVEAAVPAPLFLFLLPLGRPRPRFAGVDARPG